MRQAESLRHGCGEAALCHQALQLRVAQASAGLIFSSVRNREESPHIEAIEAGLFVLSSGKQ